MSTDSKKDSDEKLRELLRPLSEEEYAKVKVVSPEEIREALKRAAEDFRKATRNRRPLWPRY
jgi:hypothetical protein